MHHLESKHARAAQFLHYLLGVAPEHITVQDWVAGGEVAKLIKCDPRWSARITPNARVALVQRSPGQFAELKLPERDCQLVELFIWDKRCVTMNVRGEEINLFRYHPGLWESWFGIDTAGDNVPHETMGFANPLDPEWLKFLESADGKRPPINAGARSAPPPKPKIRKSLQPTLRAPHPNEPLRLHSVMAP